MGLFDILSPLRRRWLILAIIVIPITLIVFLQSTLSPARYDGTFTFQESRSNSGSSVNLFPESVPSALDLETRLNDLEGMLRTGKVVIATYEELKNTNKWSPAVKFAGDDLGGLTDFQNRMTIENLKGTDFIDVHIQADTQSEAETAATTLYGKFRDYYTDLNKDFIQRQRRFIEDEVKRLRGEYQAKSNLLKKYQMSHAGIGFSGQEGTMIQQQAAQTASLNEARKELAASQEAYTRAHEQLKDPAFSRFIKGSVTNALNPNLTSLIANLASLENELNTALTFKGLNHPDIVAIKSRIATTRSQIGLLQKKDHDLRMQTTITTNPLYENFRQQEASALMNISLATERIKQSEEQLAVSNARLREMPAEEQDLQQLTSDVDRALTEYRSISSKLTEAKIKENEAINSAVIKEIDQPRVLPVDKRTRVKTLLAFALSAVLAISLVLLLNQFDGGTYNLVQAEKALGYNVIAALPKIKEARLAKDAETVTPLGASYQMLSTNIKGSAGRMQGPAMIVASAESNVGRTTVAANLAVTLARDGARVLLVDGDLRQPNLHRHFSVENRSGLSEILQGKARVEEVVLPTSIKDLLFVPAGQPPVNPVKLLRSPAMAAFIEQVSKGTDYLIIDSPAGATFADVGILSQLAKNVVLVHEAGSAATTGETELNERLERLGANIVGIVLNKVRFEDSPGYMNFHRAYESTMELRGAGESRAALSGSERSLTSRKRPFDDDDKNV